MAGEGHSGREPILTNPLVLQVGLFSQQYTDNGTPGNRSARGIYNKDFAASADKKAGGGLRAADWLQGARTNTVVLSSMLQV